MLFDSADVAELADAHGSGPCEVTLMQVQVLSSASFKKRTPKSSFFFVKNKLTSREPYTKITKLFKFCPHT